MTLGTRLRQIRAAKKITQKEMAVKLNIARSTYAHYELGSREPDIESLKQISSLLQVSLDFLCGNSESSRTVENLIDYLSMQAKDNPQLKVADLDLRNL